MKTRLLLLLLLLLSSTIARAAGPVAVMPFKNLAGKSDLDWLKLGIAETLLADLQKDGARSVVERDQIDRALAEVMLQSQQSSEEGLAAEAGKLVGATTVVLGGFQQQGAGQGTQLRITARFVSVETGVVEETAKVTGLLQDVFALQDQIVAKLLKKPQKQRPKAKKPQKTIEAYQVYSMSLSTSSQADQVRYLKEAIALDPDFSYALEDLKALEQRLNKYRKVGEAMLDQRAVELVELARDEKRTPDERANPVAQQMAAYSSSFRWRALRDFSAAIYAVKMPRASLMDPHELASFYFFTSLHLLKQHDLALQAGERHMQEFPGTNWSLSVDTQLRNMIEDRRRMAGQHADARKTLQEIDDDEIKFLAEHEERQRRQQKRWAEKKVKPEDEEKEKEKQEKEEKQEQQRLFDRKRAFAFRRCATRYQGRLYQEAISWCDAFAKESPTGFDGTDPQHLADNARYFIAMCLAELGKFDEARAAMQALIEKDEPWARSMGAQAILGTWPRD